MLGGKSGAIHRIRAAVGLGTPRRVPSQFKSVCVSGETAGGKNANH